MKELYSRNLNQAGEQREKKLWTFTGSKKKKAAAELQANIKYREDS